jgi:putative transposase
LPTPSDLEGGTFFFTVAVADRSTKPLVQNIEHLRAAYKFVADHYPFETVAICILPDHLHAIWSLPNGDANFSQRWSLVKSKFSRVLSTPDLRSQSQVAKRNKGIWQRRYWEHAIRDDRDLERHVDYIHYNPVKHRYVSQVRDWPHSSFHRYVERGLLPADWGGDVEIRDVAGEIT